MKIRRVEPIHRALDTTKRGDNKRVKLGTRVALVKPKQQGGKSRWIDLMA